MKGRKLSSPSKETREKIGEANKKYIRDEKYRQKMSEVKRGKKWTKTSPLKGKTYEEIYGEEKAKIIKKKHGDPQRGENNHMYGRCAYDVWVEKYGKEIADKKWKERYKMVQE